MIKKISLVFLTAATLLFQSCQKEVSFDPGVVGPGSGPGSGPGTPAVSGSFKAKVDGVQFVADQVAGAYRMNGTLSLQGVNKAGNVIVITAFVDSGVHRYTLSEDAINFAAYKLNFASTTEEGWTTVTGNDPSKSYGELNVTAIDETKKTISGTFSFEASNDNSGTKKTITEGSFTNLVYATNLTPTPGNATDTLRAKVNGAAFAPTVLHGIKTFGKINIGGSTSAAFPALGITVPDNITPGTYTLDIFGEYLGIYNVDSNPANALGSDSGVLTILEHNTTSKRIRGNFNFIGKSILDPTNTATITDGYFSIKYQ